ncbi:pentapeptide repeat-containing protein [Leptolyngbya sp. FACHB-261]|uniref:pentapeptide repeat-containing protein n=1 Tax=Leptolyngbya sp. FACHB-261 TaxID=2692806 RepID=UPI0016843F90|nr:pentapeptide repeat-containing protein [Leptolyngbya sp. FACHB-261]
MKDVLQIRFSELLNRLTGAKLESDRTPHLLLFDSTVAASEVALMLGGQWDGCNGVSLGSVDKVAVDTAAALMEASWCASGEARTLLIRLTTDELLRRYAAGERNFSNANLRSARLSQCSLVGVNLSYAKLGWANLSQACLRGADLTAADLSEACLSGAYLHQACLTRTNLSRSNFSEADLSGADLSKATLSGALLEKTNLSGANLSFADLRGIRLDEAILSGANLTGAKLTQGQLLS